MATKKSKKAASVAPAQVEDTVVVVWMMDALRFTEVLSSQATADMVPIPPGANHLTFVDAYNSGKTLVRGGDGYLAVAGERVDDLPAGLFQMVALRQRDAELKKLGYFSVAEAVALDDGNSIRDWVRAYNAAILTSAEDVHAGKITTNAALAALPIYTKE